ncbi:hypothetical protein [Niallia endozanthoxylica]|uniref:PD-(D/E)XK endonuclease-like domain-containing protein n=1 Tax=Niallia endozanthoxylica TaxID=2036016 RepID=A0A5J5HM14_9BACI|nr:hypothetical protein [Niallia endozanthoxylica]KAA9021590.1 hypothetical protein F4V44_16505 [Niallia endozanthoxylica]
MSLEFPNITVKTIAYDYLKSFIKCPYPFYYQHLLSFDSRQVTWKQAVQSVINHVIGDYQQLPMHAQNQVSILELIDQYWKRVNPLLFESKVDFYLVLAKTTDHLLQFLSQKSSVNPSLFLFGKFECLNEELEKSLSLTIEVGEWSAQSFTIKKFLLEAEEELIHLYKLLLAVFSYLTLGKLPEKIEIITLLDGDCHTFSPTMRHVKEGTEYLQYMKNFFQHPKSSTHTKPQTEYISCPFTNKCIDVSTLTSETKIPSINDFH